MEKIKLTIRQWLELQADGEDGTYSVPVWFRVTGNSMFPFIRACQDDVMIVREKPEDYKVGDIVLFPAKCRGGDYCLHRIFRIDGDRVQTFGDGNRGPDGWMKREALLGRAVIIQRGRVRIDCDDPRWVRRFRRWTSLWKIRPVLIFPLKAAYKIERIVRKPPRARSENGTDLRRTGP